MKIVTTLIMTLSLFACGTKEQEPELISFEDLAGETGTEQSAPAATGADPYKYAPEFLDFIKSQTSQLDTSQNLSPHPLDRFGYSTAIKLDFSSRLVSGNPEAAVSKASVYYYTFTDSLKTKNAFYNWLDCFGSACEPVQLNRKLDKIQANPSFTLVYDTTIVAVEYACSDPKNTWRSFQDSLLARFGKTYKYRLEVKCNGPVEWK